MALILNIETSGEVCSVALAKDAEVIAAEEIQEANKHSELLTVFIENVFTKSLFGTDDLDAVAVSKGPGSYTGLRIGVSAAKGIAYAKSIPLIAVDTQKAMAWGMRNRLKATNNLSEKLLFCPMTDARRMEVYAAFYDTDLIEIKSVSADIIEENSYNKFLNEYRMIFFGSGASKCKETILHPNAEFHDDILPSAKWMTAISEKRFRDKMFEDTAYFEPFYLKDFVAQIPTKNVFGKF